VLGLEPPVDALAALPEITGLLLGNTVHAALEELATRAGVLAGVSLGRLYPDVAVLANGLVIAITETVTDVNVDALEAALKEVCA